MELALTVSRSFRLAYFVLVGVTTALYFACRSDPTEREGPAARPQGPLQPGADGDASLGQDVTASTAGSDAQVGSDAQAGLGAQAGPDSRAGAAGPGRGAVLKRAADAGAAHRPGDRGRLWDVICE